MSWAVFEVKNLSVKLPSTRPLFAILGHLRSILAKTYLTLSLRKSLIPTIRQVVSPNLNPQIVIANTAQLSAMMERVIAITAGNNLRPENGNGSKNSPQLR
jgi:hypothetical protein